MNFCNKVEQILNGKRVAIQVLNIFLTFKYEQLDNGAIYEEKTRRKTLTHKIYSDKLRVDMNAIAIPHINLMCNMSYTEIGE